MQTNPTTDYLTAVRLLESRENRIFFQNRDGILSRETEEPNEFATFSRDELLYSVWLQPAVSFRYIAVEYWQETGACCGQRSTQRERERERGGWSYFASKETAAGIGTGNVCRELDGVTSVSVPE